uniref:NAD-dependent protein deacetylase sir-2.1 n=1 Tax=Ascaris suum TaxID=6253 RepID=F1KR14_ASCSU
MNISVAAGGEVKRCSSSALESHQVELDEASFTLQVSPREAAWKPPNESIRLVEAMANEGASPREVVESLLPNVALPEGISNEELCRIIQQIIHSDRPKRDKLLTYNTFEDAVELFRKSQRILVLTGAGVSVSCGIPDFRSKDGIYARLRVDFPDLPDPTAMFDINYFIQNPKPFFEFAREIFPGQFEASICHYFIKMLETEGKLLRNYTQNIDTLEQVAGITRIVQCHGSFSKATCRHCGSKFDGNVLREDVFAKRIAMCRTCGDPKGILKPDIVFFGEDLPDEFHNRMLEDKSEVDLVVVIGSSLKVQPVALIPFSVDASVPQVLINREPLPHYTADIELLGNCDDIIIQIALALGHPYTQLLNKEVVDNHVCEGLSEARSTPAIQVRRQIDEAKFKSLVYEPDPKRTRVEGGASPIWDGRYVSVESKLPPDSFLFVAPNRCIFPGAELFYDKDEDIFCQLRQRRYTPSHSSGSISEQSDFECGAEEVARMRSLPPESRTLADECNVEQQARASSCPVLCTLIIDDHDRTERQLEAKRRRAQRGRYFSESAAYTVRDVLRAEWEMFFVLSGLDMRRIFNAGTCISMAVFVVRLFV